MTRLAQFLFLYAKTDQKHAQALDRHLASLRKQGVLATFGESSLLGGQDVKKAMQAALKQTAVVVVLVSADFFADPVCQERLDWALAERKNRPLIVVPVLVRASNWERSRLGRFCALPRNCVPVAKWKRLDDAWLDVVSGLDRLLQTASVEAVDPGQARGEAKPIVPLLPNEQVKSARDHTSAMKNPFQKVGTLRPGHLSYVKRSCDDMLRQALEHHSLIAVYGEFGIGKSSLLLNTREEVQEQCSACFLDFQGLPTYNAERFHDRFFNLLGKAIGTVMEWTELIEAAKVRPLIIFIDEIGHLSEEVARLFIPSLYRAAMNTGDNIRIVVCLPIPIGELFPQLGLKNPKYWTDWHPVCVEPLDLSGVDALVQLLPPMVRDTVLAMRSHILASSGGRPKLVQGLCYDLFELASDPGRVSTEESIVSFISAWWAGHV